MNGVGSSPSPMNITASSASPPLGAYGFHHGALSCASALGSPRALRLAHHSAMSRESATCAAGAPSCSSRIQLSSAPCVAPGSAAVVNAKK